MNYFAQQEFSMFAVSTVYEYEPMWQLERAYRYTGRPVLIGEFHIGVPANGLGAGLVQAKDQKERGNASGIMLSRQHLLVASSALTGSNGEMNLFWDEVMERIIILVLWMLQMSL